MFDRHTFCRTALSAIYGVTGVILLLQAELAHAICAFAAAAVYAAMIGERPRRG